MPSIKNGIAPATRLSDAALAISAAQPGICTRLSDAALAISAAVTCSSSPHLSWASPSQCMGNSTSRSKDFFGCGNGVARPVGGSSKASKIEGGRVTKKDS
ncbi:basic leucine zipper 19 [Canna indica]|uniref:Basic leucine zipper 19 n=1 Tax=Canna indica TaxID=4628 RepID=A0AAQ3QLJ8_9LILI|nr:basic leucine zipper 19 [Canna indica]